MLGPDDSRAVARALNFGHPANEQRIEAMAVCAVGKSLADLPEWVLERVKSTDSSLQEGGG